MAEGQSKRERQIAKYRNLAERLRDWAKEIAKDPSYAKQGEDTQLLSDAGEAIRNLCDELEGTKLEER